MKNYVNCGEELTLIAPAGGVVGGLGYIMGAALFVVASSSEAAGDLFSGMHEGVIDIDKKAATAMAVGDVVGFDEGLLQIVPAGDAAEDLAGVGIVVAAAGASDATARVKLTP